MRLSFHGAAGGVTGSCHRLELGRRQVLIDCGLFQGGRTPQEENAAPFGFDPAAIDILILTHAHLDHCGRIPLLVRRGFRGEIICTAATRELARLVLLDAASLNEEEARRRGRRHAPLFDTLDVMDSLDRFGRIARLGEPIALGPGVTATLHEAGHILGSASVLIETGAPLPPPADPVLGRHRPARAAAAAPAGPARGCRDRGDGIDLWRPQPSRS
ncbi:MAG: hypothetical protein KatS3mg118_2651 [Paracoccaceae bacterium]|nr:MAG: hypothetical protein KatS3mg118_2651 [Paracoccaceae bacterium]